MRIGNGAWKVAQDRDVDLFTFINYAAIDYTDEYNKTEFSIFTLPDLKDFDGVILTTNSFNLRRESYYLVEKIQEAGIPAVSLEGHLPGMDYIGVNNKSGMEELADHLFKEHQIFRPVVIGGMKEHEESKERIAVLIQVAKQYGVSIPEENIIYGNWNAERATNELVAWLDHHDELPDAIICMNDVMALGVVSYMKKQGYRVPEDCIVTGLDGLFQGQQQEPILTTVNHEWEKMGRRAVELLLEQIAGRRQVRSEIVQTNMLCGESCGCYVNYRRYPKKLLIDGFATDQHFRHLYKNAKKSITAESFNKNLSSFFQTENWLEGDNFMLCLNKGFFDVSEEHLYEFEEKEEREFDEQLDVICALHNGTPKKRLKMTRHQTVFRIAEESEKPGNYIFAGIGSEKCLYGFGVITRDFEVVNNNVLYIWTRHMCQFLEQVRMNIEVEVLTKKLERMSVTDGLTKVYNRSGMDQIMIPFMERVQNEGGSSILLMVDIDRMKKINDSHGHMMGDVAVQTVAQVLSEALPKDYYISRYGGDEFVCVGEVRNAVSLDEVIENIQQRLNIIIGEKNIEFALSVSIGGIVLEKGEIFDFKKCMEAADAKMYAMKEVHHGQKS